MNKIDRHRILKMITKVGNKKHRKDIRHLAETYYDWDVIAQEYVDKMGVSV